MATKAGPNIITDGLVLNIDPANVKSYPAGQDPYANNVSLMLGMDGANNSTTFTDFSVNNLTVTVNDGAKISTTQSKFGGSAGYFDGTNDYISVTNASLFDFSASDWTIEMWIYFDSVPTGAVSLVGESNGGGGVPKFGLNLNYGTNHLYSANRIGFFTYSGGADRWINAAYTWSANTWYHIAVVQSGSTITLYVNGQSVGSMAYKVASGITSNFRIGSDGEGYKYFTGYIDDFRLSRVARYTTSFTPPSAPFSLPGRVVDLTKNGSIGNLTNGPVFSNIQNGVMSFDGAGDYLDFSSSESFNFSNNNFYIESWIYLNQYPVNNNGYYSSMIICKDQVSNRSWDFLITGTSSANTTLQFTGFINNSSIQQANISYGFNLNTWYHVACSRVGNYIYLYVNGICINPGGTSFTATIQNTSSVVRIGAQVYTTYYYYFNGNIANLKVYNNRGLSADEVQKNYRATRKRFVEPPKTIPGLQLWLDGADLSTMRQNSNGTTAVALNGDPVGYWADKSGNGRHAIQATSASRPLLYSSQINGLPALQFDGSDDWLYTNTSGTVGTIINVYYHTNSGWGLYDGVFSIRTNTYLLNASSFCYSLGAPSNSYSTKISLHASPGNGNGVACDDLPSPADSRINGQIVQSAFNYYTQGQTVSQLWNIVDSRFVPVSGTYNIGFGVDICCAGRYSPMKYVECLIYDRYLSDSELKTIYGYLNQKWSVF